jgi:D-alanine transaminase
MPIEVRTILLPELRAADEVWISAATRDVAPITRIDGKPVGAGKPGPYWQKLDAAFANLRKRLEGTPAL